MYSLRSLLIAVLGLLATRPCFAAEEPRLGQLRLVRALPASLDTEFVLGFSADGRRLLSAGGDAIVVWDVKSGQKVARFTRKGRFTDPTAFFLPDGKTVVASAWGDKEIFLFDLASGQVTSRIPQPQAIEHLTISPDGKTLVSYCKDGFLRRWDVKTRKELWRLRLRPTNSWSYSSALAFSPKGKVVALAVQRYSPLP